jgi:hypothetical protein
MIKSLTVLGNHVEMILIDSDTYISLTDIARYESASSSRQLVQNWLRGKSTLEFLGLWEKLHNGNFKGLEFEAFRNRAGSNAFVLTPKEWILKTKAIGIISKPGRYGGTYAHEDIALEFVSWISAEFKLYLVKEFRRLKSNEQALSWDLRRELTKINFKIHSDAIEETFVPPKLSKNEIMTLYATESDLLNKALFGMTANEWKSKSSVKKGNLRDHANLLQLVVLSNLESLNAVLLRDGLSSELRLKKLNEVAISQMKSLVKNSALKRLSNTP